MHHSGPLPLTFEGPEQGFGGKNCQNGSGGGGGGATWPVQSNLHRRSPLSSGHFLWQL